MQRLLIFICILCVPFYSFQEKEIRQDIDLVFCLDISSSNNGLVDQFKKYYWDFINDFNRYHPQPRVRLSVICYGRGIFTEEDHYTKVFSGLTTDFEGVFSQLDELNPKTTRGWAFMDIALGKAFDIIETEGRPSAFKHIIVIGNGPAEGKYDNPVKLIEKRRKDLDVKISTMFYESYNNQKDKKTWAEIAKQGGGTFRLFDFEEGNIVFEKEYDYNWILELGHMMRQTYVPYGKNGLALSQRDHYLDSLSASFGMDCIESRLVYKASRFYQATQGDWDLVDLYTTKKIDWSKLDRQYLPLSLSVMDDKDLKKYIEIKKIERRELIAEMGVQCAKRDVHLYQKYSKLKLFRKDKYFYQATIGCMNDAFDPYFKITY